MKKSTRESPVYRNLQNSRNKQRKKAATKIQAWFRGNLQRKKYQRKLEIARINAEQEKELNAARAALSQAMKNRVSAEEDLKLAAEELRVAQAERKKARETKSIAKTKIKRNIRSTLISNTAASIIQKCWRNHQTKRNRIKKGSHGGNLEMCLILPEETRMDVSSDHNSSPPIIKDESSPKSTYKDGKQLFRQNTGSRLNTLPKTSNALQPKESTLPQNFESGYFNKVFKSTVAINGGKEKEASSGRPENSKKGELLGLQPPSRGDRSIGKSMEISEKMAVNRSKRLSFDHGDSTRNYGEGGPTPSQAAVDPLTQSLRRTIQRSNSTVSSSGHNIGSSFMDSIPKGYDDLHFHSIVRGNSIKKN